MKTQDMLAETSDRKTLFKKDVPNRSINKSIQRSISIIGIKAEYDKVRPISIGRH